MMVAVDTNILVRLLTKDDKKQADIALAIFEKNMVFVSKTVLLECEWVLRGCYEIASNVIADAFEGLMGVSDVTVEEGRSMMDVILLYRQGIDFGDAMHLISSKSAKQFISFDKKLIKKAKQLGVQNVVLADD